jgi:four helix bundle protein
MVFEEMSSFKSFEDIEAWQKARVLVREVYGITNDGKFAKDFGLKDQIRRASVSIMSNIAEGLERGGNKEFLQFLFIAKGSAGEVRSQLFVALDQHYVSNEDYQRLMLLANEVSRMIAGLIKYLQSTMLKGTKFKAHQP